MTQRTLQHSITIEGKALHTGQQVTLVLHPAPVDHGIVFCRKDLEGRPTLKPGLDATGDLVRNTSLCKDGIQIHTVEHILSALNGCGVRNAFLELDGPEPPVLDGSAKGFVERILATGIQDQGVPQPIFVLKEALSVIEGDRSIIALPYDGLKITCTSLDDRGRHTQHFSIDIDQNTYIREIAPARTFALYEDVESLLSMGKIKGASLDSGILLKDNDILSSEPLRFENEFVRHKILDILGDIALLGVPIKAHIIAIKPGHAINATFTNKLRKAYTESISDSLNITEILKYLPHRYPFMLVDRVLSIQENSLVALKCVSFNEPYFQGHFPGKPVMPGVLQIEAMAQAAGILMLRQVSAAGKLTFFMSCDKVKFRRVVEPGDQLHIHVQLHRLRQNRVAIASGQCFVQDHLVSSAEMMFTLQ